MLKRIYKELNEHVSSLIKYFAIKTFQIILMLIPLSLLLYFMKRDTFIIIGVLSIVPSFIFCVVIGLFLIWYYEIKPKTDQEYKNKKM